MQQSNIILNSTYSRTWCGLDIYDALSVIGGQFLGGPPDAKCNAITTFSLKELNNGVVGREIYSFGDLDTGRHYTKVDEDNVTVFRNINNHYLLTDKRLFAYKSTVSPDAELTHFIIPTLGDYLLATDGSRDTALINVPGHIVSVRRIDTVK